MCDKMNFIRTIPVILLLLLPPGCSHRPEKTVDTLPGRMFFGDFKSIKRSKFYVIEDSPGGVLKILNENGEVVVNASYQKRPVYLQIFATSEGLVFRHYDKDEYDFEEE